MTKDSIKEDNSKSSIRRDYSRDTSKRDRSWIFSMKRRSASSQSHITGMDSGSIKTRIFYRRKASTVEEEKGDNLQWLSMGKYFMERISMTASVISDLYARFILLQSIKLISI